MLSSREKISTRQAIMLFIMITFSASIRLLPVNAAKTAERAGWLTPIFAVLPFLCLIYIIQALFKNDNEANLSDIIFKALGRIFGTALLILYLIWMMVSLSTGVRYFAERFLTSLLPNTHIGFFLVTILAAVFYVLQGGIVYITRTAELLLMMFLIIFTSLFILTVPNFEIMNLFPVTHYDIWPLVKSSTANIAVWSYFTYIFFFGNKINDKEHIKRFGKQGSVYMVITTLMVLIQTIGVYGYSVIERVSMPYIFVAKSISILDTIEKIESVAVASWIIIDFVGIAAVLYITASIIKSLFSLSEVKPFVSTVAIFAFVLSQYLARNQFELESFSNYIAVPANIIFGYIFPLIILIVGKIRKKI